jgi:hypoxanthine phosphoribosyltransferase
MAKLDVFLSASEIDVLTTQLAERISADYAKVLQPNEELLVVVTLKGALFFAADLMRKIQVPTRVDFVRLSSYGARTSSSGTVKVIMDLEEDPRGQHILVLDEIVDSGRTLSFLFDRIRNAEPKSVKLCALLSKPSRREVQVETHYLGREVEDKFLVGYGLDHAERYRSLKDIYALDSTH